MDTKATMWVAFASNKFKWPTVQLKITFDPVLWLGIYIRPSRKDKFIGLDRGLHVCNGTDMKYT